jgi:PKD domain-containing protein
MTLTGGFDLVISIADAVFTRITARLHAAGQLSHRNLGGLPTDTGRFAAALGAGANDLFDFVFGTPVIVTAPPQGDGQARVTARTRAIVRARPSASPSTLGAGGIADISFRARFDASKLSQPIAANDALSVDWAETSAGDVVVTSADRGFEEAVRTYVLQVMTRDMSVKVPLTPFATLGAQKVVPCTLPQAGGGATFATAVQVAGGGGSTAMIENVLRDDWAIGLSRDLMLSLLIKAMAAKFGGALPRPYGPAPVTLDQRTICLFDTPFGCAATATRRVLLNRLVIDFLPGAVLVQGTLGVAVDGLLGFEVDADWSTMVTLSVDNSGTIRAEVGPIAIALEGALAALANLISGGQLESTISDSVESALSATLNQGGPADWLRGFIGSLASQTGGGGLRPVAVDVRSDGLVIHGAIDVPLPQNSPVASLSLVASPSNPRDLLLSAANSWSPGSNIASLNWRFGDGASITANGTDCRLAVEHTYAQNGIYRACLEITDDAGRVSQSCTTNLVGGLNVAVSVPSAVRHAPAGGHSSSKEDRPIEMVVSVSAAGAPISGTTVVVHDASSKSAEITTDSSGRARVTVERDRVRKHVKGELAKPLSIGSVEIKVSGTGLEGHKQHVWLPDNAAIAHVTQRATHLRKNALDSLAKLQGLSANRHLLDQTGGSAKSLTSQQAGKQAQTPRNAESSQIGAAFALMDQITNHLVLWPQDPFLFQVLGLPQEAGADATVERLKLLWGEVRTRLRQLEKNQKESDH